jgi:hypothetical protein
MHAIMFQGSNSSWVSNDASCVVNQPFACSLFPQVIAELSAAPPQFWGLVGTLLMVFVKQEIVASIVCIYLVIFGGE